MSSIDYAYKSYVMKEHNDLIKAQKRVSRFEYSKQLLFNYGVVNYTLKNSANTMSANDLFFKCFDNGTLKELKECVKINHADYERVKRLKERVRAMLLRGACIFLTLTFTDNTLAETTQKQRRNAVTRFLKQYNCPYIANIDFGIDRTKTMREHYHALINCEKISFNEWRRYGNINAQRVRNRDIEKDKTRLSKYIAKLSNHAIKEQAKRSSLIYSR